MPEFNENDLRTLFQAAKHHVPEHDLTDRILARVAVTPILRPTPVKPLIAPWGWSVIGVVVLTVVMLLIGMAPRNTTSTTPFADLLRNTIGSFSLPQGAWPLWLAGGSFCLLMLALLDQALTLRTAKARN